MADLVTPPGPPRKLPALEPDTAFFWTAGQDGVLRIQRCSHCGHYQHPPLPACPQCHSDDVAPADVSGKGRVLSHTINVQSWTKDFAAPFVFAVIELAEQKELYLFSNILAAPEAVHHGLPVEVCFEPIEDVWIPLFRPAQVISGEAA
jgi:uncharacterized OB-fold protein